MQVLAPQPGMLSYTTACDAVSAPWTACAGGAVIGPNGVRGVCGPCEGGIGPAAAGLLFGRSGAFPQVTPVLIGASLLLVVFLLMR